jgi:hypothetical protein
MDLRPRGSATTGIPIYGADALSPSQAQATTLGRADTIHNPSTRERVIAGAGGIGSGSICLLIADQFPPESLWNQLLRYFAPWATALTTVGWLYLQGDFVINRQLKRSFRDARNIINQDLATDGISDFQKHELQGQLKELRTAERDFFGRRTEGGGNIS